MSTDVDLWEGNKKKRNKKGDGDGNEVSFVTKLGAAKHALTLAQELPEFSDLIDHAEAVRAAAKALHISSEGINAWTRFVIDAERKAWARIEAMRETGELASRGQTKAKAKAGNVNTNLVALPDIIEHRPTQRAFEWKMLAKLTEHQIDELERLANDEDRILSRHELMQLARASTPKASKGEKYRSTEELAFIERAQERAYGNGYQGDDIEIREDAKIDRTERGAWVEAWVWVIDPLAVSDLEDEEERKED